jgi:predicted aspartyl protease
LVVAPAELEGPGGSVTINLALDTGAVGTLINLARLVGVGYDPNAAAKQVRLTTSSGSAVAVRFPVLRLKAPGQQRTNFPVVAHALPATVSVDGLLGLDFLRGLTLTVDFRLGRVSLT